MMYDKAKKGDNRNLLYGKGSGRDYADCVAQDSPNSIIIENRERERMKGSDMGLTLPTETGNEAGCGVVEAW